MKVLIKSAKIINRTSLHHQKITDIYIKNGKIEKIGENLKIDNLDREINFEDLHVSVGWFDTSVSFGEPGYEERETISHGLETAARSGFTGVLLNPNTNPVIDDNGAVTSLLSKSTISPVKMYPIGALTKNSLGKELAELYDMKKAGAVAFGDYKKSITNSNLLKLALQYAQGFDGVVISFPHDNSIAGKGIVNENENSTQLGLKGIPALAEELQIERDLAILEYTGGKLHIPTISTAKAVELIKKAKKKGLNVTCSTAVHNMVFTDDLLHEFDTNAKVLPPLRTKKDVRAIMKGIKDEVIDFVTSDHTPIDIEHKKIEFEHALYGTIGLETAFGTLLSISTNLGETIDLLTRGRSRFNIMEPEITEGSEANLTLFTPSGSFLFTEEEIISTSKNSVFLNSEQRGKVYGIISGKQWLLSD